MSTAASEPTRLIQAVDRSLRLLEVIADAPSPPSAPELARLAGVNRSTAWRLLATLEAHHLVERDPLAGTYTVGFGALRIAAGASYAGLVRRARPVLERLNAAVGENAALAVVRADRVLVLDEVVAPHVLGVRWAGSSMPLAITSPGKLWLAALPRAEAEALVEAERAAGVPIETERLWQLVDEAGRTGIGTSPEDFASGVTGFSAAVRAAGGRPTAFVGITGPAQRLPLERLPEYRELLLGAAAELAGG
jgi:DNA-binding IclR family transcriptional regulator